MSIGEAKVASESASSYDLRMPDAWSPSGHRGLRAREKLDLIFSNAALPWVPDHPALLQRLTAALAPGGQLAVQMPMADELVTHRTASALARSPEFKLLLGGYERRSPLLEPTRYAAWLHRLGYARQHVRVMVYTHLLDSRDDVVEWVRGALLTDYQ